MKCIVCNTNNIGNFLIGKCNPCIEAEHTCDVCKKHVDLVWINILKGRGHKECLEVTT